MNVNENEHVNQNQRTGSISLGVIAVALAFTLGCGAAKYAALKVESVNNMKMILIAVTNYKQVNNGEWPTQLSELDEFLENSADQYLTNPLTGENPGYEYVKPEGDVTPKTIVLYHLRDGQRAEDLPVGYADGSVAELPQ